MTQPAKQLPLSVSIGSSGTDSADLTPAYFALPAGAVTATPERAGAEETLLSGYGVRLVPLNIVRAITVRIDVPDDHPLPRALGERWASLLPGTVTNVSETHTSRGSRTQYVNAEIVSNTLRVTRQASLTEAYYSGSIEARVLIEGG